MTKKKRRQKLGEGFIWFVAGGADGYTAIALYKERNGVGQRVPFDPAGLGAWQKVKLYGRVHKIGSRRMRYSARYKEGPKETEFACAATLIDIGRAIMRVPAEAEDTRCIVVWDSEKNDYVDPIAMVGVYKKLMR